MKFVLNITKIVQTTNANVAPKKTLSSTLTYLVFFLLFSLPLHAKTLRVAVSANFTPTLRLLTPEFERKYQQKVEIISAATGTLFQQISYGAPFDIYMAADTLTTDKLIAKELALTNSKNVYAYGQLALWSANKTVTSLNALTALQGRLAIANPNIAPYGNAAKELLKKLGLWENVSNNLITGTNINQTFQQARSGAVELAIIAHSQLIANNLKGYVIAENLYPPIEQSMVILKRSKQIALAKQFTAFIMSAAIQKKIKASGYQTQQGKQ